MSIIRFSEDDSLRASGRYVPDVIAIESGEICDGGCGLRPELHLPADEYMKYIAEHGERKAPDHSHLVLSRISPNARRYTFPISKH